MEQQQTEALEEERRRKKEAEEIRALLNGSKSFADRRSKLTTDGQKPRAAQKLPDTDKEEAEAEAAAINQIIRRKERKGSFASLARCSPLRAVYALAV